MSVEYILLVLCMAVTAYALLGAVLDDHRRIQRRRLRQAHGKALARIAQLERAVLDDPPETIEQLIVRCEHVAHDWHADPGAWPADVVRRYHELRRAEYRLRLATLKARQAGAGSAAHRIIGDAELMIERAERRLEELVAEQVERDRRRALGRPTERPGGPPPAPRRPTDLGTTYM